MPFSPQRFDELQRAVRLSLTSTALSERDRSFLRSIRKTLDQYGPGAFLSDSDYRRLLKLTKAKREQSQRIDQPPQARRSAWTRMGPSRKSFLRKDWRSTLGLSLVGIAALLALTFTSLNNSADYLNPNGFRTSGGDAFRPSVSSGLPSIGSGPLNDRDCSDFGSWRQAQRFYERFGRSDPHRLDEDGDGIACELLRWR